MSTNLLKESSIFFIGIRLRGFAHDAYLDLKYGITELRNYRSSDVNFDKVEGVGCLKWIVKGLDYDLSQDGRVIGVWPSVCVQ